MCAQHLTLHSRRYGNTSAKTHRSVTREKVADTVWLRSSHPNWRATPSVCRDVSDALSLETSNLFSPAQAGDDAGRRVPAMPGPCSSLPVPVTRLCQEPGALRTGQPGPGGNRAALGELEFARACGEDAGFTLVHDLEFFLKVWIYFQVNVISSFSLVPGIQAHHTGSGLNLGRDLAGRKRSGAGAVKAGWSCSWLRTGLSCPWGALGEC